MPRNRGAAASSDNGDYGDYGDYGNYGDDGDYGDDEDYYNEFWKLLTKVVLVNDHGYDFDYVNNMSPEELKYFIDTHIEHIHNEIRRRFGEKALNTAIKELENGNYFAYYGMVETIVGEAATAVIAQLAKNDDDDSDDDDSDVSEYTLNGSDDDYDDDGPDNQPPIAVGIPVYQGHPTGQGRRAKRYNKSRRHNKSKRHNKSRRNYKSKRNNKSRRTRK